MATSTAQFF